MNRPQIAMALISEGMENVALADDEVKVSEHVLRVFARLDRLCAQVAADGCFTLAEYVAIRDHLDLARAGVQKQLQLDRADLMNGKALNRHIEQAIR